MVILEEKDLILQKEIETLQNMGNMEQEHTILGGL